MKTGWWGRGASAQKRKHAVLGQLKRDTKHNRKSEETVHQECLSSAQWIKQRAWLGCGEWTRRGSEWSRDTRGWAGGHDSHPGGQMVVLVTAVAVAPLGMCGEVRSHQGLVTARVR